MDFKIKLKPFRNKKKILKKIVSPCPLLVKSSKKIQNAKIEIQRIERELREDIDIEDVKKLENYNKK